MVEGAVAERKKEKAKRKRKTRAEREAKAVRREEPVRAYADMLHREMALVAAHLGPAEVSHIHWGGGTPNALPPDSMTACTC